MSHHRKAIPASRSRLAYGLDRGTAPVDTPAIALESRHDATAGLEAGRPTRLTSKKRLAPATRAVPAGSFDRKRRGKKAVELRTLSGTRIRLRKPVRSGGIRKRGVVPPYWRTLVPGLHTGAVPEKRLNLWLLVLAAKKIPYVYQPGSPGLYVPPLYEQAALADIRAVEGERPAPVFAPPSDGPVWGALLILLPVLFWHALRWRWIPSFPALPAPPFPLSAHAWPEVFGLDIYRFRELNELWRAVTALGIHADDAHLFSNLGFGLLFFIPLCRRAGAGLAMLLVFAGGVAGNAVNALFKEAHVISIGFSTSLFAGLGGLCALTCLDAYGCIRGLGMQGQRDTGKDILFQLAQRIFLPLAAGLALLGLLGGGANARTDYSAHIWGFVCGLILGLILAPLDKLLISLSAGKRMALQSFLFLATCIGVLIVWGGVLLR